MSQAPDAPGQPAAQNVPRTPKPASAFIHRVCTQCNNVFRVPADKFDAKQCPKCHKG